MPINPMDMSVIPTGLRSNPNYVFGEVKVVEIKIMNESGECWLITFYFPPYFLFHKIGYDFLILSHFLQ